MARGLARTGRMPGAVILGGSHSAFSAAWMLLERLPGVRFGLGGVQILYRSEPRVMYPSRAEARAESYGFTEADVCQATGRVHRVGGLRGDGREVWRRMHGKAGVAPDRRAIAGPIRDLSRAELIRLLDDADLIVSALGYRLATVPVFDAKGDAVPRRARVLRSGCARGCSPQTARLFQGYSVLGWAAALCPMARWQERRPSPASRTVCGSTRTALARRSTGARGIAQRRSVSPTDALA